MGKYDFIKLGNLLYWHDPDSGLSNGWKTQARMTP